MRSKSPFSSPLFYVIAQCIKPDFAKRRFEEVAEMIPINLVPLVANYWPHLLGGLLLYTMLYLTYDR